MARMGVIKAVKTPDIRGLTTPRGAVATETAPFTINTMMPSKSSKPSVFSHLLLTRTRLLWKLPKMLVSSSIMTGLTSENMSASISPGIINAINPRSMRMPVIMLAANK